MKGDRIIKQALTILEDRLSYDYHTPFITCPDDAKDYFRLRLGSQEREIFSVMFLNNKHSLIAVEDLFQGTVNAASVHPREVVKAALRHNASAVILSHNHPSGNPQPSANDVAITRRLKESLELVDVRVLDHIVVGARETASLADRGQI